jgi:anti-anti-sigma factor
METKITNEGDVTTIEIQGRLDNQTSQAFEAEVLPIFARGVTKVQIDCSQLEYISSSGLRVFLKIKKAALNREGDVTIIGISAMIKDVFEMTGFASLFNIK